jgi:hypothetical protein
MIKNSLVIQKDDKEILIDMDKILKIIPFNSELDWIIFENNTHHQISKKVGKKIKEVLINNSDSVHYIEEENVKK